MVGLANRTGEDAGGIACAEAPKVERVKWMQEPYLRKLYLMSVFLLIASATIGYDSQLMHVNKQIDKFKEYYDENGNVFWLDDEGEYKKGENLLGIMVNMFNIGSIISFFPTAYLA